MAEARPPSTLTTDAPSVGVLLMALLGRKPHPILATRRADRWGRVAKARHDMAIRAPLLK